jgi:hypothetical protein
VDLLNDEISSHIILADLGTDSSFPVRETDWLGSLGAAHCEKSHIAEDYDNELCIGVTKTIIAAKCSLQVCVVRPLQVAEVGGSIT